jgi:hypothetical protein
MVLAPPSSLLLPVLYTTNDSPLAMWDVDRPEKKREEIWDLVSKAAAGRFQY